MMQLVSQNECHLWEIIFEVPPPYSIHYPPPPLLYVTCFMYSSYHTCSIPSFCIVFSLHVYLCSICIFFLCISSLDVYLLFMCIFSQCNFGICNPFTITIPPLYMSHCNTEAELQMGLFHLISRLVFAFPLIKFIVGGGSGRWASIFVFPFVKIVARGQQLEVSIGFRFSACKNCHAGATAISGPFYLVYRLVSAFSLVKIE